MNVESSKKINFVYEWLGPYGPLTNNNIPNLIDFSTAALAIDYSKNGYNYEFVQKPHFYTRFKNNIRLCSPSNIPDGSFFYEFNFNLFHYRDMLGSFHRSNGFLDRNKISDTVVQKILNKEGYVLITLLHEGYMYDHFLKSMIDYLNHKNVPLSQVVYMSNCQNGQEVHDDFCRRNNISSELKIEYFPTFRFDKCDISNIIESKKPYEPGKRVKKFLCFNRRYNEHRLLVYLDFFKKGLLKDTFMSMSETQPESDKSFIENAIHFISIHKKFDFNIADVYDSSSLLPLTLDTPDFSKYPMESSISQVEDFYKNSYINIVTETYFFSNIRHITEKTYKPIAFMQPFIIFAAPGTLQHLKDLGFKTFEEFWNEEYDSILDHEDRFIAIMNLIKDLSCWSDKQMIDLTYAVKEILEYNRNHLLTMKDPEIEYLLNKYGT